MNYNSLGAERFARAGHSFGENIFLVRTEEEFQRCDFMSEGLAFSSVSNTAGRIEDAHGMDLWNDVGALRDGFADRFKMMMLRHRYQSMSTWRCSLWRNAR